MTETIGAVPGRIDQLQLAQQLLEAARAKGVELIGPGGLLTALTKTVLETTLDAEMSEHLGYDRHDPAGRDGGNSRNGTRTKTVLTENRAGRDRGSPRPGRQFQSGDRAQTPTTAGRDR